MRSAHGKGGRGTRGGVVVEGVLNTPKGIVITLYMTFLTRQPIFPNLNFLSQNSLMKNIKNI